MLVIKMRKKSPRLLWLGLSKKVGVPGKLLPLKPL